MNITSQKLLQAENYCRKTHYNALSISSSSTTKEHLFTNYDKVVIKEFSQMERLFLTTNNSTIVYSNDYRRLKEFFSFATMICLDFDSGVSPEEVSTSFRGVQRLIISSQSSTKLHPRFHLIMPLETPITDYDDYKQYIVYIAQHFKVQDLYDKASSSSRVWSRCKEVIEADYGSPTLKNDYGETKSMDKATYSSLTSVRSFMTENLIYDKHLFSSWYDKTKSYSISDLAAKGARHNAAISVAGSLKMLYDLSKEEIVAALKDLGCSLKDAEIVSIAKSASKQTRRNL